jgi:DNA-binding beta-propeller fold protein YncE
MMNTSFHIILILILAQLFSSPSYAANQDQVRLLWPPPPKQPQFEFVGVFTSEDDLAKSKERELLVTFLGEGLEENLRSPTSVATLDTNTVLVSESGSRNIKVFDFAKGETRELFQNPSSLFEEPVDVVIDAGKNIFVVDQKRGVIAVFDNVLNPTHRIGTHVEFEKLEKVAIDSVTQTLYVSDSALNKVFAFDQAGQLLFEVGDGEEPDSRLKSPHGLAVDSEGRLYVADTGSSKIKIFDSAGNFLRVFKFKNNSASSVLEKPWDLAFDSQGLLHIIDQKMAALITCNQNGEVLYATMASKRTNHSMGFNRPNDIHIDSKDRIFITDDLNNRFCIWQILTKAYLAENPVTDEDIETLKTYIAKLQTEHAERDASTEAIAMQNEEEKKNLEGTGKEPKGKRKRQRVVCPNCDAQYDLVFVGLDNQ